MRTTLRPRLCPNCTCPAASANSVSSPPRPTRSPGWNFVPRCRTRISPALTSWPPYRFTPSRWAAESRPLRELDAPFLCAIACLLPALDAGHLHLGQRLAVTEAAVVAGLVLEVVDADLGTLGVRDDLAGHRDLGQRVRVGGDVLAVNQQERRQRDAGTRLADDLLDLDDVADRHLVLLSAGLDDGVHRTLGSLVAVCRGVACGGTQGLAHLPAGHRTGYGPGGGRVKPPTADRVSPR